MLYGYSEVILKGTLVTRAGAQLGGTGRGAGPDRGRRQTLRNRPLAMILKATPR